jgi:tRNA (Thr-GGU) A37 N-methylase
MNLRQIGTVHSPHQQAAGTPVQSALAAGVRGTVEVFSEYEAGLRDLDGSERIWCGDVHGRGSVADGRFEANGAG